MSTYKISGTTSHDADVHVIQNDTYFGKKAVSAGAYEVTIESTVASGITTVAKKSDGDTVSYGDIVGVTSSGVADLTAIIGGGAQIENIQSAIITIPNTQGWADATITEVNMSNTMLLHGGWRCTNDVANGTLGVKLNDSTTLRATRLGSYTGTAYVVIYVVEFVDGTIDGVQRGEIVIGAGNTENSDTINYVGGNVAIHSLGTYGAGSENDLNVNLILTGSTQITAYRASTSGNTTVSYEVIDFG